MSYALMTSGGKDSTLALDRALREGRDVTILVNIYDGATNRVRFHGVRQELIASHAHSQGVELLASATTPTPYESVFDQLLDTLRHRGLTGIIFGNIHLTDVRTWFEDRVRGAGFEHVEPLWQDPPETLVREFIDRGFRAVLTSVELARGAAPFLGREIDHQLIDEMLQIDGLDVCGEHGEYHSFVFDGPTFAEPVSIDTGETVEMEGHRLIDLTASAP